MLRTIPGLRWSCEMCRVSPWALSSRSCSSNGGNKNASSGASSEGKGPSEAQVKGKKIASKEEVKLKLSGLLSSLKVQGSSTNEGRKELKLATSELRRVRRPAPPPESKQALKQQFQAVGPKMAKAVEKVAEEVGGGEETQKELLESLEHVRSDAARSSPSEPRLSPEAAGKLKSTLSHLSVEKRRSRHTSRRFENLTSGMGLFDATPLNIFPPADDDTAAALPPPAPLLPTWEAQAARDLRLCTARPADSHFQELINWTEQGKVWQFPVNNEFGIYAEEANVGFQDHIFLERHLSPWCPKRGPIAHFMELVCVGLSKNPYITAQRKKDTILWYRDYFESKKKLLQEIGAMGAEKESTDEMQA